jgi:hypothetical protein
VAVDGRVVAESEQGVEIDGWGKVTEICPQLTPLRA